VTLNAWITTARGRLLDRLIGGETLRQRLRETDAEVKRLSVEVSMWQRRAEMAEGELMSVRRRRTD
jgi:hypothetical protein